jgi:WD40 repeat protein
MGGHQMRRSSWLLGIIGYVFLFNGVGYCEEQVKTPQHSFTSVDVLHMEFSRDGKHILKSSPNLCLARMHDITTGVDVLPSKCTDRLYGYAIYTPYNRHIAVIGDGVTMCDLETSDCFQVSSGNYKSGVFTPDGEYLFLAIEGHQGRVVVLDTHSWEEVRSFTVTDYSPFSIVISPDGNKFAIVPNRETNHYYGSSLNWEIPVYDLHTYELLHVIEGHKSENDADRVGTRCAVFSPDSKFLLSGGKGKLVKVWDSETGLLVRDIPVPKSAWDICFTPDRKYIVVGGTNDRAYLVEFATGELIRTFRYTWSRVGIKVLASPDNKTIVTGAWQSSSLDFWDISDLYKTNSETPVETPVVTPTVAPIESPTATPTPTITPLPTATPTATPIEYVNKFIRKKTVYDGDPKIIYDLDFIPGIDQIVTLDRLYQLVFWQKNVSTHIEQVTTGLRNLYKMALTNNGRNVWIGGCSGNPSNFNVVKVDSITGEIIKKIKIAEHIYVWDIDAQERYLFYAIHDQGVFKIDLGSDQHEQIFELSESFDSVEMIKLSPDNSELAIVERNYGDAFEESKVVIWDINENRSNRDFHFHKSSVDELLWTQDGDYLYFYTMDYREGMRKYSMELFETATGNHIGHLHLGDQKGEVELSPNGVHLLFSEWNKKGDVALVDFFSGKNLKYFRHNGEVYSMAFNQDGTEILTGTKTSLESVAAAYLWDISDIPVGNFPDTFVASTPTPTMTITPTFTPDQPMGIPTDYQIVELDLKADLLAINPRTDDIISTYYDNSIRRLFITTPSGDKTEITPDSEEDQQVLTQSFKDMCVSEEGVIYFIGDELVEFNPNRVDEPVRQFDISGRNIHVVSEKDRIPGTKPGMLLILRTPDDKKDDNEWAYLGWKYNEMVLFNPQTDPAEKEIYFSGEEFLRGVGVMDMTIGPDNRLFFVIFDGKSKLLFLNDGGLIEEYSHFMHNFGNVLYISMIYSPVERSFFILTYDKLVKVCIDDLSEIEFASLFSYRPILQSSISGDKIYISHEKRKHCDNNVYILNTEKTLPTPTPTPQAIIPTPTPTPIKAWYVLDGFGGIHSTNADVKPPVLPYFMDYNIVRDIEPDPQGKGWYMLDGFGGIHQSSVEMQRPPIELPYFGFDIARNLEVKFTDGEYNFYMLDGYGGIHTNDENFKFINLPWNQNDVMRDLEPVEDSSDWMAMDDKGYIYHNDISQIDSINYYFYYINRTMRGFIRFPDDRTVMLDFYGGRHTNSFYPANDVINGLPEGFYFPGWEIIWDVEVVPENMID